MSLTDRMIKALLEDNDNFWMTFEDIQNATVQEILLYYAYNQAMSKGCGICADSFPGML